MYANRNGCPEMQLHLDLLFQSSSESVIKKATLLSDMHIKGLRQKMTLIQLREESAKKLEVN